MTFTVLSNLTPRLPGLPPLAFNALTLFGGEIKLLDKFNPITLLLSTPQPVWGLFTEDGAQVVEQDSVLSFEYKNDWSLSTFPQEEGAFSTYNKVNSPYDARIRLTKGGTEAERTEFLTALQQAADSLDLYSIVTPEITYLRANIQHIDYQRTNTNGANLLVVDVWLLEIRSENSISKFTVTPSQNTGSLLQKINSSVSNAIGGGVSFLKNTVKSIGATAKVSLGQVQAVTVPAEDVGVLT